MLKRVSALILLTVAICVLAPAQSPTKENFKKIPPYFTYGMGSLTATPSTNDSTSDVRIGGVNLASITVSVADTIRDTVWVMVSTNNGATYTPVASAVLLGTDHLVTTYAEILLRLAKTDLIESVTALMHVSSHPAATANGTATSYPVITPILNWKP